jgi:hypothetical protein
MELEGHDDPVQPRNVFQQEWHYFLRTIGLGAWDGRQ